jgi:hypothetical protein
MVNWLTFWRSANWRQNRRPFMLLASAEVTLGVRTILEMVKNRVWHWQHTAAQQHSLLQQQQQHHHHKQRNHHHHHDQEQHQQWRLLQQVVSRWQQLQSWLHLRKQPSFLPSSLPSAHRDLSLPHVSGSVKRLAGGHTTLYQLGVETNQQMVQGVLDNTEVSQYAVLWTART